MTTDALSTQQTDSTAGAAPPPRGDGAGDNGAATPTGAALPLWERWSREPKTSRRRDRWLAEARRGAGKEAGTAPALWPLYREHQFHGGNFDDDIELQADHICLVLFAFHQQSQSDPVHRQNTTFGAALRRLRSSDRFRDRESALDARVYAAATAIGMAELETHLRSIVRLIKDEGVDFDYTSLYRDLVDWQRPGGRDLVRQRWGRDYYWQPPKDAAAKPSPNPTKGN